MISLAPLMSAPVLIAVAVTAVLVYGYKEVERKFAVRAAVAVVAKAEQIKAGAACDLRVSEIEVTLNQAVADKVRAGMQAALELAEAPAETTELQALCEREASCRDRKKGK